MLHTIAMNNGNFIKSFIVGHPLQTKEEAKLDQKKKKKNS